MKIMVASRNSSRPKVHETKIEKIKSTPEKPNYNTYRAELSFGQLLAIRDALAKDHANPVADELHQELNFFLDALPKPGEEFDKDSKELVDKGQQDFDELDNLDIDAALPMPGEEPAEQEEIPDEVGLEAPPEK